MRRAFFNSGETNRKTGQGLGPGGSTAGTTFGEDRRRVKRICLITALLALIFLVGLAAVILRAREPGYRGRTLSGWIRAADEPDKHGIERGTAINAIRQIGPDAIPVLLKWVQAKDYPMKRKLLAWLTQHPSIHFPIKPDADYHFLALNGFAYLGSDARGAWPTFIQWTYSKDLNYRIAGLVLLQETLPDRETFLPTLLRLIHDSDPIVQIQARSVLRRMYLEDAKAAGVLTDP